MKGLRSATGRLSEAWLWNRQKMASGTKSGNVCAVSKSVDEYYCTEEIILSLFFALFLEVFVFSFNFY